MRRAPTLDKEWLREQYITKNRTRVSISEETGLTPGRIGTLLQEYGITRYSVKRHGLSKHPLNAVWYGIKERCTNPNTDNYKWYGADGIVMCEEWLNDFIEFYQWAISSGWKPGLTVDRIDRTGGYSPNNCRLITAKQQCRNRRSNVVIDVDGEKHLQCEWEELLGLRQKTIAKWKMRHGIDYVIERLREESGNANKNNY